MQQQTRKRATRKQPTCEKCGHKLAKRPTNKGTGYAHKKREHWASAPHPAIPVWDDDVS